MDWVIRKVNSNPDLYLKVDVNGLFAYDTNSGVVMKFVNQSSADQLRRVIIDETESVQV